MEIEFEGILWYWRGPAPHYFVTVPPGQCDELRHVSGLVTYGWGMIPAHVRIGKSEWKTSLFPKDGGYIVPIKANVRKAEGLEESDEVTVRLTVAVQFCGHSGCALRRLTVSDNNLTPQTHRVCNDDYHVSGIPTQYVIDPNGIVRASFVGYGGPTDDMENAVRAAVVKTASK